MNTDPGIRLLADCLPPEGAKIVYYIKLPLGVGVIALLFPLP